MCVTTNPKRPVSEQGFTLLEVMLGVSVLLVCTLALGLSLQAGAFAARQLREEQILLARAQTLVDRMVAQEFGHTYDPAPVAAQLEEILDNDAVPGDITLHQLSRWPEADAGWRFVDADTPVEGEWLVTVDEDLDGDGLVSGELEAGGRLFRIRVFFDGRLILETNRAKEVAL